MKTVLRIGSLALACTGLALLSACKGPASDGLDDGLQPLLSRQASLPAPTALPASSGAVRVAASAPERTGPIRIEVLDANESPPTFVMRGSPRGPARLAFLHGMCGHGLGYAQSFQFSGARKGTLIAPQGDVSCGGVFAKWSGNTSELDARITNTFSALGDPDPTGEIVIIGMSQGATRAAALAGAYPLRYTRLIAMDGPTALRQGELRGLHGAVLMAGERDRQDLMRASQRALAAGGIPATFMLIPEATHGAMGPTPEQTMGEALDWLFSNARP